MFSSTTLASFQLLRLAELHRSVTCPVLLGLIIEQIEFYQVFASQ